MGITAPRMSVSGRGAQLFGALFLICALAWLPSRAASAPSIEILALPEYGSWPARVEGKVSGVDPATVRVATLVFVSGLGYFSKPTCAQPLTSPAPDGTFAVPIATGGVDDTATRIALVVVPAAARVPCFLNSPGVPAELEALAVARIVVLRPDPNERHVDFSGERFIVKANRVQQGPGPNLFSSTAENVFVDRAGKLHLKVTGRDGLWHCAEVISRRMTGYGTYRFTLDSGPRLDPNVVFGAFTWVDGERSSSEIDLLEIGKFGRHNDTTNAQVVIQPYDVPGNLKRFLLPDIAPTSHILEWLPERVAFRSLGPTGTILHEWVYPGSAPRPSSPTLNFRFNLWLFNGVPPTDGMDAEVVISSFSFEPYQKAEQAQVQLVGNSADVKSDLSPGALFSILGKNLAAETARAPQLPLPSELAGVTVRVNGTAAPLLYVSPSVISGQIPYRTPIGAGVVTVESPRTVSVAAPSTVGVVSPALFRSEAGTCVAQNADGSLNAPERPARTGEVIVTYLTGIGEVDNHATSGHPAPRELLSRPIVAARATVDGAEANLRFLGLTPGFVGLAQANIEIPPLAGSGTKILVLSVGDVSSTSCSVSVLR